MFRNNRICSIEHINSLLDHTLLLNIGSNTHAQIDTHLALTNEHIDWTNATDNLLTTGTGRFDGGIGIGGTPVADMILIETDDAADPTLCFKTTKATGGDVAHQVYFALDQNAVNDNLLIEGQTESVNTAVVIRAQDGETAQLDLFSGPTNRTEIAVGGLDHFSIKNKTQNKNIVFGVENGEVSKTITWNASADKLQHSAGTFNFDDDNIITEGTGSFGEGLTVNANKTNQRNLTLWGIGDGVDARGGSILWRRSVIGDDPLGYTYINDNSQFVWDATAQASSTDTGFAWVKFLDGGASFGDTALASLAVDTDLLVTDIDNHKVEIGSADGSDKIQIYHDDTDAYTKWNDGDLYFQTDEGTNSTTRVNIKGKGTGFGVLNIRDQDDAERLEMYCFSGVGYIETLGSNPVRLSLQEHASSPIRMFENAASGETQELQIYGFRAADAKRSLEIGVGTDAADTASFDGLSNYLFDGTIKSTGGAELGDGGITNYLSVSATGDVNFVGGAGLVSGSFWGNEIGFVAAGGTGTYFEIFDGDITTGQLHNVTHNTASENTLDIGAYAGMYAVFWSMSAKATGANKHIIGAIGVDAGGGAGSLTAQNDGRNHAVSTGNAEFPLSGGAMLDLSANSEVGLMATNETDNTNVTIEHVSLVIGQWGGT